MPQTKLQHLFDPEVWAALIQAEFPGQVRFAPYALTQDTLEGVPGSEVDFPKWDALGELDELEEGVAMGTQVMGQTTTKARIKEYGKAVEITDTARLAGLGDPEAEAVRQFGVRTGQRIDTSLIEAAMEKTVAVPANKVRATTPHEVGLETLNWDGIVDATAAFGDEWEPSQMAGLFIRSDARSVIWKSDDFIKAADLGRAVPKTTGLTGVIAGVPVIVTDRLPENTSILLRPNALGLLYKRRPLVEYDRDILARTDVIATNVHYAVKRLNDRGVCVIRTDDGAGG